MNFTPFIELTFFTISLVDEVSRPSTFTSLLWSSVVEAGLGRGETGEINDNSDVMLVALNVLKFLSPFK